jgi:hypothetical protein
MADPNLVDLKKFFCLQSKELRDLSTEDKQELKTWLKEEMDRQGVETVEEMK